jgi:hypothetical protein
MKPLPQILVSVAAACLAAGSAQAFAADTHAAGTGHWAWVSDPIIGPKAAPPSHHRIWISDQADAAAVPGHWQRVARFSVGPRSGAPSYNRVWISER